MLKPLASFLRQWEPVRAMFAKVQTLASKQQDTIKDFLSAYILKSDLQKNLNAAK